jgi:hypothetical protein
MTKGVFIPRFPLGHVVMTQGVVQFLLENNLDNEDILPYLRRHQCGDWGEMPEEDKAQNDRAVNEPHMLMSCYRLKDERIWIITDWDRQTTTFLLPEEY